jgi:hypothetical protein
VTAVSEIYNVLGETADEHHGRRCASTNDGRMHRRLQSFRRNFATQLLCLKDFAL